MPKFFGLFRKKVSLKVLHIVSRLQLCCFYSFMSSRSLEIECFFQNPPVFCSVICFILMVLILWLTNEIEVSGIFYIIKTTPSCKVKEPTQSSSVCNVHVRKICFPNAVCFYRMGLQISGDPELETGISPSQSLYFSCSSCKAECWWQHSC